MEKFLQIILSVFKDKLLPAVISLAVAIFTFYLFPNNSAIVLKLGKELFIVFIAFIVYIVIDLGMYVVKQIKKYRETHINKSIQRNMDLNKNKSNMDRVNRWFDDLSKNDKYIILGFLFNKNKPFICTKSIYGEKSILEKEEMFLCTRYDGSIENIDENKYWCTSRLKELANKGYRIIEPLYQFRLTDEMFKMFANIYNSQGYLGSFKDM